MSLLLITVTSALPFLVSSSTVPDHFSNVPMEDIVGAVIRDCAKKTGGTLEDVSLLHNYGDLRTTPKVKCMVACAVDVYGADDDNGGVSVNNINLFLSVQFKPEDREKAAKLWMACHKKVEELNRSDHCDYAWNLVQCFIDDVNAIMPGITQDGIDPLDSLESQIEELEKRILGSCDISEKDPHIIESLVESSTTINNSISNNSSIKTLFDRLDQLGRFTDPSFEDTLIDIASKKKVVLDSSDKLCQYLFQSKKVCELNNTLNGEPFKKVPSLVENLRNVSHETITVQNDYEKLKKNIENMSMNYMNAIKALTLSFSLIDTQLSKIEDQVNTRETKDVHVDG